MELNIKNETQVKTWFRWYSDGETSSFHQQVGKQYSYNKGIAELLQKSIKIRITKKRSWIKY